MVREKDSADSVISYRLKRWVSRHRLPEDGRERLLWSAGTCPVIYWRSREVETGYWEDLRTDYREMLSFQLSRQLALYSIPAGFGFIRLIN
jgi:hypothetical protein